MRKVTIFRAEIGGGAPRLVSGDTKGGVRSALMREHRANLLIRAATQSDLVELLPETSIESAESLGVAVSAEPASGDEV